VDDDAVTDLAAFDISDPCFDEPGVARH
jgi:hypothetical protein